MKKPIILALALLGAGVGVVAATTFLFEDEHVAEGRRLFVRYCSACHGKKGQGNGYNAVFLDPRPRDLTDRIEPYMAQAMNEDIFSAINTGVAGVIPLGEGGPEVHVHQHGDHGGAKEEKEEEGHQAMEMEGEEEHRPMEMKMEMTEEEHRHMEAEAEHRHEEEGEHQVMEMEGEEEHRPMEMKMEMKEEEEEEFAGSPQMPYFYYTLSEKEIWSIVAYIRTLHPYKGEPVGFPDTLNNQRPQRPPVHEAEYQALAESQITSGQVQRQIRKTGKRLFKRYGCDGCHRIGDQRSKVGPPLDEVGAMLQPQYIYRWIRNPRSFKPKTRMPNMALPKEEAQAITTYLSSLKGHGGHGSHPQTGAEH